MLGLLLLNYHCRTILSNESPEMMKFSYFPGIYMHSLVKWAILANKGLYCAIPQTSLIIGTPNQAIWNWRKDAIIDLQRYLVLQYLE